MSKQVRRSRTSFFITEERKYKYSSNWRVMVLSLLMFGGSSLLFYSKAVNNDANVFYRMLFLSSIIIGIMILFGIYFRIKKTNYLIIDDFKIIIPLLGFRREFTTIPFVSIFEINETQVNNGHVLTLYFENGKRNIVSNLLSNKNEYLEIKKLILTKINERPTSHKNVLKSILH
ncbi:hypothetical protein [uncultured Aquimarina sp.]|uniref:hypothetical protein n=1 Tax=uncultured Aquimarina sp. TaxID=575652 RepID=UPI00260C5C81|nr:hypothetical protein [uncultured Aquimarina sp.]